MTTAALGGEFEVPTLDGAATRVKVPEGTQNGPAVPPEGQGHADAASQPTLGDLYVQIGVETPQNLTKRQRELLEEFEKLSSQDNSPQSSGFFSRMKEFFEVLRQHLTVPEPGRSIGDEAVADAGLRADDLRVRRIAFDLAAQLADEDAQIVHVVDCARVPRRRSAGSCGSPPGRHGAPEARAGHIPSA